MPVMLVDKKPKRNPTVPEIDTLPVLVNIEQYFSLVPLDELGVKL